LASLVDLLNNKDVADDQKITINDAETTVGELRQGWMRQQDYTKKTTDIARHRKELEQERSEWEYARLEAEGKLNDLARQIMTANPGMTKDEAEDEARDNPAYSKLNKKLESLEEKLEKFGNAAESLAEEQKRLKLLDYERQHRAMLLKLKEDDPNLDVEELIDYAKQTQVPRLDVAYKALRYEDKLKEARKKGMEEGIEKGRDQAKQEFLQPAIPTRRAFGIVEENGPKNLEEALNAAIRDPEIMSTFRQVG
jgi:hypothetical protein